MMAALRNDELNKAADEHMKSFQERLIASTATAQQILAGRLGADSDARGSKDQAENKAWEELVALIVNVLKAAKKEEAIISEIQKTKDWDTMCEHLMKLKKPEILEICKKKFPAMGDSDLRLGKIALLGKLKPE